MTRTSRSVIKFVCVPTLTRLFLLVAHTSQRLNETRRTRKVTEEEEIPKAGKPNTPLCYHFKKGNAPRNPHVIIGSHQKCTHNKSKNECE